MTIKTRNPLLKVAALAGASASTSFGAIMITDNFSFPPTTHGENTPTFVYLMANIIGDNTIDLVDFKFDARSNAAFIWNGGQQQTRDAAFNDFGTSFEAPTHTIGIALSSGGTLGNGAVWGLNFMTFRDADGQDLGNGSEMVLGFDIVDLDSSGSWKTGDSIKLLGVAYDDGLPTDGSSEVSNEANVRAAFAAIPEPSTGVLALFALAFGFVHRRR